MYGRSPSPGLGRIPAITRRDGRPSPTTPRASSASRQVQAARQRVPGAEILNFPGGHLTTSEHPDLLATAIRDIASRYGAGAPARP
jgi:pimeloyl-ACP methyl ester carboxylesterase